MLGSKNKVNNVKTLLLALKNLKPPKQRGRKEKEKKDEKA
jgi:ribosomal protein S5